MTKSTQTAGNPRQFFLGKLLAAILLILISIISPGRTQTLPNLINFSFSMVQSNLLPGTSSSPGPPCNGTIAAADQIQNLGLASQFYQNDCYTDGRYNDTSYPVVYGTVSGVGGATNLAAYTIYQPLAPATQFLGSQTAIYYRFPTVENYTIYSLSGGVVSKVATVPASAIPDTNTFILVPNTNNPLTASSVSGSVTYIFAPSATRVSSFTALASGVEGAQVATTPFGNVLKYRYTVTGAPFDTPTGNPVGPATGTDRRRFFLVRNGNGGLGVVWQDQVTLALNLTWFGTNFISPSTVALSNAQSQLLACATGDDTGNVYFLTIQAGNGAPNTVRNATLTKAGPTGATIATSAPDTSATGLNMVDFGDTNDFNIDTAAMTYLNGNLGVMLVRIMTQTPDGLNHQGGIAVEYDSTQLTLVTNWGQTSGHSWDNFLTTNSSGQFVGFDRGDNFPRGININKFNATNISLTVISSYKTQHGTTANSPSGATYPVYTAISTNGVTYYEWSNDNNTYGELGGLAQTSLGYTAGFIGEPSPAGFLLDNSRVSNTVNDPRNVALISVVEAFQNFSDEGIQVSNTLVETTGAVETNGYYNFTGGWVPQRNAGVVWLTSYTNLSQNATRLKVAPRTDGSLVFIWELWSLTNYVTTRALTVAPNGTVINAETDLGTQVRLDRRDDTLQVSNSIYLVSGDINTPAVQLMVIQPTNNVVSNAPRPVLGVTLLSGSKQLQLTWTNTASNYVLQVATNIATPAWSNVPSASISNGPGGFLFDASTTNGKASYFRLAAP